ncbi:hypothetical protein D9756_008632 [Leucocoprinus leucothites]|uniref:BTB domain-containing protein n=1 Tax=Leucocoprinus leucothites TaxID=201217 RepID=A0A8H5D0S3_9AGAR|nr:hypothetical protein D9756_008632 [Leucoagaricus leucothites]
MSAEPLIPEKPCSHHAKYYFKEDPMATFLANDCLFRVHRHFLLEGSQLFRDMFNAQPTSGPEGSSDARPIILPGVKAVEFEVLIDYFYTPPHLVTVHPKRDLSFYLDLMSISHRFLFDEIFQHALQKVRSNIGRLPLLQQLQLGEKYDIDEWQSSALEQFATRPTILTIEEAEVLGLERILQYMQSREAIHAKRLNEKEQQLVSERQKNASALPVGQKPPLSGSFFNIGVPQNYGR